MSYVIICTSHFNDNEDRITLLESSHGIGALLLFETREEAQDYIDYLHNLVYWLGPNESRRPGHEIVELGSKQFRIAYRKAFGRNYENGQEV